MTERKQYGIGIIIGKTRELCKDIILDCGGDFLTVGDSLDRIIQENIGCSEAEIMKALLDDTLDVLNNFSPEVENLSFDYEFDSSGNVQFTVSSELEFDTPYSKENNTVRNMLEELEYAEESEYEYDD